MTDSERIAELENLMSEVTSGTLTWVDSAKKTEVFLYPRHTNGGDYNGVVVTDGEVANPDSDTRFLVALWNAAPFLVAAARERDKLLQDTTD